MSSAPLHHDSFGLRDEEAAALGADGTTRVRIFRLVLVLAQQLRTLMDQRLRPDGLTTQQAALISVVDALDSPSLSASAAVLGTTHQNVKQLASTLERKGFMHVVDDESDRRVRRLTTTAKSRDHWAQRSAADQREVTDWFSQLTADEAATLFDLLLRLQRSVAQRGMETFKP